jgi:hypothetical protein
MQRSHGAPPTATHQAWHAESLETIPQDRRLVEVRVNVRGDQTQVRLLSPERAHPRERIPRSGVHLQVRSRDLEAIYTGILVQCMPGFRWWMVW